MTSNGGNNQMVVSESNNNCYYDVILFAADLAPKNDFSLVYLNGKVYFANLSHECVTYFLNRFKNFDIMPKQLFAFQNCTFKIELNSKDIYENFTTNLKSEMSINRCTNLTLRNLSCMQFLLDTFIGAEYCLILNDGCLELCEITSQFLSIIVEKMRHYHLTPQKMNFSSHSNFHIILDYDEILRLTEKNGSYLHCITSGIEKTVTVNGASSLNNSLISTDDSPVSNESVHSGTTKAVASPEVMVNARKSKRQSARLGKFVESFDYQKPKQKRRTRNANSTTPLLSEKNSTKKSGVKSASKSKNNDEKESERNSSTTVIPQRSGMMNATDMDSNSVNGLTFNAIEQHQQKFIDETIANIIKQDTLQPNQVSYMPFIKQEAVDSPLKSDCQRHMFSSNSKSGLIYTSPKKSVSNT